MKKIPMATIEPAIRKNNFEKFLLGYSEEEVIQEAKRCLNCPNPRCVTGCPISNNIPQFIHEVSKGNFEGAYKILLEKTVLPEICGTVCPHEKQCQGHCVKGIKGDPVTIGAIERFVGEYIRSNHLDELEKKNNGKSIAVIGSGPAGMASSYYLAKKGYEVTIYEKENYLGGVLTWGIPSFRLEKEIVKEYFERLSQLGVKIITDCNVGIDISITELKEKYDAVIIGTGALIPNKMRIPGEDLPYVIQAKDFLSEVSGLQKGKTSFGEKIVVVGGGNVAMDAARSAIRLPEVKEVTIIYRRSENEMPACKEEYLAAKEEGVELLSLTNPVYFHEDNKVECCLMELGQPDQSGRRRPIESDKEHIFIEADTVILALGFSNDPTICNSTEGLDGDKWGCFLVDENNQTSLENVYGAGDAVTGAQTVVLAMKQALNACKDIDEKLCSK